MKKIEVTSGLLALSTLLFGLGLETSARAADPNFAIVKPKIDGCVADLKIAATLSIQAELLKRGISGAQLDSTVTVDQPMNADTFSLADNPASYYKFDTTWAVTGKNGKPTELKIQYQLMATVQNQAEPIDDVGIPAGSHEVDLSVVPLGNWVADNIKTGKLYVQVGDFYGIKQCKIDPLTVAMAPVDATTAKLNQAAAPLSDKSNNGNNPASSSIWEHETGSDPATGTASKSESASAQWAR